MNEDNPNSPADEKESPKNRRDWGALFARTIRFIAIALGMLSVAIILIVGLALGACFLSRR